MDFCDSECDDSGADEEDDEDERAEMLPAEEHWEREALISTKSESPPQPVWMPLLHVTRSLVKLHGSQVPAAD